MCPQRTSRTLWLAVKKMASLRSSEQKEKCLYGDSGHSMAYSWLGHKSDSSYRERGEFSSVWKTCSISCFLDSKSLYRPIKKSRYCNQGALWACLLALILYINLPIWTGGGHNFLKVMRCEWDVLWHRKVSVCVCVSIDKCVSGLQESVSLIASQPSEGSEWYPATGGGGGVKQVEEA